MTLPTLSADCSQCAALCCVGLTLDKGPLFSFDKPAGEPCPNLVAHQCACHAQLDEMGNSGCLAYDCAGAGQRIIQERFNGESWQDDPGLLHGMLRDFAALKPLHERMRQLVEAAQLPLPEELETERRALLQRHARLWADTDTTKTRFDRFIAALGPVAR